MFHVEHFKAFCKNPFFSATHVFKFAKLCQIWFRGFEDNAAGVLWRFIFALVPKTSHCGERSRNDAGVLSQCQYRTRDDPKAQFKIKML